MKQQQQQHQQLLKRLIQEFNFLFLVIIIKE